MKQTKLHKFMAYLSHTTCCVCIMCYTNTSRNCTTTKFIIMCSVYFVKADELKHDK